MAYFIVIGTDNDVKGVVDEVKGAHLQHNVITSGCIVSEEDDLYYHWDVFNERGERTKENREPIVLHNALTNQISQFKTLLPEGAIANVFIVSKCFDEKESETLQMVCEELDQIGGAMLSGLLIDIVLVGYDLNKPEDVTIRPHWRLLESLRGLCKRGRFHANVLYVNNMDYMGAATNVDSHTLAKFICHWSKVVCAGGYDPMATVNSDVYAIGLSEHQYDFGDLNDFFKLSAEERILDRTLHDAPSPDTAELLDTNYFKKIDLSAPWIDGLCTIKSSWAEYCTLEWDQNKPLSESPYSLSCQEQAIASFLNSYLALYISEEQREIDRLNAEIETHESEKSNLMLKSDGENEDEIKKLDSKIDGCSSLIKIHEENIRKNKFYDADSFIEGFGNRQLITDEDEADYNESKSSIERMIEYVKSAEGIAVMREAVERATVEDELPDSYPASEIANVGHLKGNEVSPVQMPTSTQQPSEDIAADGKDELSERSGCLFWFKDLFRKKQTDTETSAHNVLPAGNIIPQSIDQQTSGFLNDKLEQAVVALRKADEVRSWWSNVCEMVEGYEKRQKECSFLMDGEKDVNGDYVTGKTGYRPAWHRKSVSLIDMDRVRYFRDNDNYYRDNVNRLKDRWFDKSESNENRMTMLELIKHQVLDPLVGRYHTLKWDGSNPFVNEIIPDAVMHEIIEEDIKQSKPFVEYVRIKESNLNANLNISFYSNNQNIPVVANEFRDKYEVGTISISPVYLEDFVNSLCVMQVLDIPEHVDAIMDFKPKMEAQLSRFKIDIKLEAASIVGSTTSVEGKARAIYDWICANIAYDTTEQIHDAETCYRTHRGVCQAYCELFCRMAEAVGLTADIIVGKIKDVNGEVSEKMHSWIFVYTHAYEGIFMDPTWGAGSVDGTTFHKNENDSMWFNVTPYWMIFSHYPDLQYWSKLDITVTEDQFRKLPYVLPAKDSDGKDFLFECVGRI
jgi:hypothetical protein